MQSITSRDGTRKRAFCLACFEDGKDWIGGELCEHLKGATEAVAPTAKLDSPIGVDDGA